MRKATGTIHRASTWLYTTATPIEVARQQVLEAQMAVMEANTKLARARFNRDEILMVQAALEG